MDSQNGTEVNRVEHNILSLDFWKDTVTYEGHTLPTGAIGCKVLNIPDALIEQLKAPCEAMRSFSNALNTGKIEPWMLPKGYENAMVILELLHDVPPFDLLDYDYYTSFFKKAFTKDGLQKLKKYSKAVFSKTLTADLFKELETGILLGRIALALACLHFTLSEYKQNMVRFAKTLDAPKTDRTPDGLAAAFNRFFTKELSADETNNWMSHTNATIQYLTDDENERLICRMHYMTFVSLFRSDLFEGLRVGHAPKQCRICGRWFLTTNARPTKYCGGFAPDDKYHRTCRQIGNLQGREQRELADDHPLRQIYETRTNTINRYVKRGTLNVDLAKMMKKLAKDKMLRAISDVGYAQSSYLKEMEQDSLKTEAEKLMK